MDEEYLTEHWLFAKPKDDFELFIELCIKKLNELLENEERTKINVKKICCSPAKNKTK